MTKEYSIKRLRKEYNNKERWVPIGTVVVNDDGTGSVYLNHQDEIWRIFLREKKNED